MFDEPSPATEPASWNNFSRPVFEFALVLRAADLMPDDEDEYWERPHKWEPEHELWTQVGAPSRPEAGQPPSLAWQRFLRNSRQNQA